MSNILNIGKSALGAAQIAIDTTGHNIANASTVGYSRQEVIQTAATGQDTGFGYVGKGTTVVAVRRIYSEYLGSQVLSAQTTKGQLDSYYTEIQQINNMLADSTVGLSPSLQNFFDGLQDVSANPNSSVSRQSLLSTADTLVAQFQSLSGQLKDISQGINSQIKASTTSINSYAKEIATLNDAIEKAQGRSDTNAPNDLLDQRDQLLADLSKDIRVSIVKQGGSYDVYIGNGIPLVIGSKTYSLSNVTSPTDPSRLEVAYQSNGVTTVLADNVLSGGNLSGLLEFRSETLDAAQNSLGRIATVLATTFNEQHSLGQDQNGALGGNFFNVADPLVTTDNRNTSTGVVSASIADAKLLTTSNYRLSYDGGNYSLTRLSDNVVLSSTTLAAAQAASANEGFSFSIASGPLAAGDKFLIRPTANGASGISLAITDTTKIAAAAPILAAATSSNSGTGKVTAGVVNTPPPVNANLQQPVTISFNPDGTYNVTGTGTGNPTNLTYTAGGDITYNGWTIKISGAPASGDTFTIGSNTNGVGDNRNALLLSALQTTDLVAGSSATYQGAYSQMVNMIGNKTSELEVTSSSADKLYTTAYNAQQSVSGVNLDEEAANLLRYQQAYQAAAKVMKTASDLFDTLLNVI
jgi:flagellar hook-associated protein 1